MLYFAEADFRSLSKKLFKNTSWKHGISALLPGPYYLDSTPGSLIMAATVS